MLAARALRTSSLSPGFCSADSSSRSVVGNARCAAPSVTQHAAACRREVGDHRVDAVEARAGHHAGVTVGVHRVSRARARYCADANVTPVTLRRQRELRERRVSRQRTRPLLVRDRLRAGSATVIGSRGSPSTRNS